MNCPSRTDELLEHDGLNQNPSGLSADLTTRQDLNGIVNRRTGQDSGIEADDTRTDAQIDGADDYHRVSEKGANGVSSGNLTSLRIPSSDGSSGSSMQNPNAFKYGLQRRLFDPLLQVGKAVAKFGKFIGPGFMISVAYIDPGNYSTDVAAGAATKFKLLFIVMMSNLFAIVLQSLAVRLGTVTGLNLAENCRLHLPRWLNIFLYILGEAAIIATDIAEVSPRSIFIAASKD